MLFVKRNWGKLLLVNKCYLFSREKILELKHYGSAWIFLNDNSKYRAKFHTEGDKIACTASVHDHVADPVNCRCKKIINDINTRYLGLWEKKHEIPFRFL